jgi:hypothetical protein
MEHKPMSQPDEKPATPHVHTKMCYDDPGPANGHPFLVCELEEQCSGESIVGGQIAATGAGNLCATGGATMSVTTGRASSDSTKGDPTTAGPSAGESVVIRCHDCQGTLIYKRTPEGFETFHDCSDGERVRRIITDLRQQVQAERERADANWQSCERIKGKFEESFNEAKTLKEQVERLTAELAIYKPVPRTDVGGTQ